MFQRFPTTSPVFCSAKDPPFPVLFLLWQTLLMHWVPNASQTLTFKGVYCSPVGMLSKRCGSHAPKGLRAKPRVLRVPWALCGWAGLHLSERWGGSRVRLNIRHQQIRLSRILKILDRLLIMWMRQELFGHVSTVTAIGAGRQGCCSCSPLNLDLEFTIDPSFVQVLHAKNDLTKEYTKEGWLIMDFHAQDWLNRIQVAVHDSLPHLKTSRTKNLWIWQ